MAQPVHNRRAPREGVATRDFRAIDLTHLAKQCLGDRSLECEVLRVFDQVVEVYYERVCAARGSQDLAERLRLLKAAARGVGAWTVFELARIAEAECRTGFGVDEESIADLGMAVAEVRGYIAELVADDV